MGPVASISPPLVISTSRTASTLPKQNPSARQVFWGEGLNAQVSDVRSFMITFVCMPKELIHGLVA
jgi:hypothetical protein